jgi:predicted nuclease of restriction endonuclease-like RecB superfamily
MLTRDLLRYRVKSGVVQPVLLSSTPAITDLAARLLAHWQSGIGQRRGDLDDGALPILHESHALVVGRGLAKIITDACVFADPTSAEELRAKALAASAARLVPGLPASADAFRAAVAGDLGLDAEALAEGLYADLPDLARLEFSPDWAVDHLIAAYNLELCQGLLLSARELRVHLHKPDTGRSRRVLAACRFHRLLAEVRRDGADLHLTIGGPDAVLDQASRYGMNLAQFLPRLAAEQGWTLAADLRLKPSTTGHGGGQGTLTLDHRTGLPGQRLSAGFVPPELRELITDLTAKLPTWTFVEPTLLPLPSGEIVVPDLAVQAGDRTVQIELFHRWHGSALARRLDHIEAGRLPDLVIGVERGLAKLKEHQPQTARPGFAAAGFLFTDIPVVRAVKEAVERRLG